MYSRERLKCVKWKGLYIKVFIYIQSKYIKYVFLKDNKNNVNNGRLDKLRKFS